MEKEIPLVSVCCITYNHAKYIDEAIEGFLMQKTSFHVEIIIHDDASTDGTDKIVKGYADKYPDKIIPIFQKENQYSKGIKPFYHYILPIIKGKYIALCEGDDYWTDPLKLQKQVDFLEGNGEYVACFHNAVVKNEINNTLSDFHDWQLDRVISSKEIIVIGGGIYPTASLVFRNIFLNGFKYPAFMLNAVSGDRALSLLLITFGCFYFFSEKMIKYRVHLNGVSSSTIGNNEKMAQTNKSNLRMLNSFDLYSKGRYSNYIKDAKRRICLTTLQLRPLNLLRDFVFLKELYWRDAFYLIRKNFF